MKNALTVQKPNKDDAEASRMLRDAAKKEGAILPLFIKALEKGKAAGWFAGKTKREQYESACKRAGNVLKAAHLASATVRVYTQQAAKIVLVPDAVGVIETGPEGEKSIREVTAKTAKKRDEFNAVAKAAAEKIGLPKRGTTGSKKKDSETAPADTGPVLTDAEKRERANKAALERDEEDRRTFARCLKHALSGLAQHGMLRETLDSTLAEQGRRIAMIALDDGKVVTAPVPLAPMSRGQKAAETRRHNARMAEIAKQGAARAMHAA